MQTRPSIKRSWLTMRAQVATAFDCRLPRASIASVTDYTWSGGGGESAAEAGKETGVGGERDLHDELPSNSKPCEGSLGKQIIPRRSDSVAHEDGSPSWSSKTGRRSERHTARLGSAEPSAEILDSKGIAQISAIKFRRSIADIARVARSFGLGRAARPGAWNEIGRKPETIKAVLSAQPGQNTTQCPTPPERLPLPERPSIDARCTAAMIRKAWLFWLHEQVACARVPRLQHCKCFVKYGVQPNQPNLLGLISC